MEFVVAPDGTRIAYRRGGTGPALVLVHGAPTDHSRWVRLFPALETDFTVYALDRRGRGESDETESATYAIEREFEDVAAVVDAVGEPAHLLGHSYGALCALEAGLLTNNVRSLVLYEPPIPIPPGAIITPPQTLATMEAQLSAGDREGVVLTFLRELARLPEDAITAIRSSPSWPARVASAHTILYEARAAQAYVFDPKKFHDLTTPTLLLLGEQSAPFMRTATEAITAAIPYSRMTILPGQGHVAMDSDPDLFLREVVSFLNEV